MANALLADDSLKSLLGNLATLPGVSLAVLVDREGFLIESAGQAALAAEVAGALTTCLAEASADVGRELGHGSLQSIVLEYESGTILVNPAGPATMLATMVSDASAIGRVRRDVDKTLPELIKVI
jgi:predicted regulator of Ras-like GTPase activity (Roadblock/LC7/MglB family)